jgi:CheY-like chemotaxis protein
MWHPAADLNRRWNLRVASVGARQQPDTAMPQKRILLVEDEPAVRDVLAHVLWTEGYHVDAAATFPEAITLLDTVVYDLVIADWRLPEGNGLLLADIAAELGAKRWR